MLFGRCSSNPPLFWTPPAQSKRGGSFWSSYRWIISMWCNRHMWRENAATLLEVLNTIYTYLYTLNIHTYLNIYIYKYIYIYIPTDHRNVVFFHSIVENPRHPFRWFTVTHSELLSHLHRVAAQEWLESPTKNPTKSNQQKKHLMPPTLPKKTDLSCFLNVCSF